MMKLLLDILKLQRLRGQFHTKICNVWNDLSKQGLKLIQVVKQTLGG